MLVAARGLPSLHTLAMILVCLVSARTAAMSFNRFADWDVDLLNPRTAHRHTLVQRGTAFCIVCVASIVFVAATFFINRFCFILSPACLALVMFYSFTKRFTAYSHFFLGLALAAAPMGAWAAVRGDFASITPWLLAFAVLCWTFGFDLVYATQDTAFDKKQGLHSFPAKFGDAASLRLARALHLAAWLLLGAWGWHLGFGWKYLVGWLLIGGAFAFEHAAARHADSQKMNRAFFEANAAVSMIFLLTVGAEIAWA